MDYFFALLSAFVFAIGFTWIQIKYAHALKLVDKPNQRSSHSRPTPSGGGLSILISFIIVVLALSYFHPAILVDKIIILGAISILAIIGLIDDMFSIPIVIRLFLQFSSCFAVLHTVVHSPNNTSDFVLLSPYTWPIFIFAMVWLINLYNFMDGIDGLAASQTVFVCLIVAGLLAVEEDYENAFWMSALASSTAGFLIFNWPKASIFMGDTGSGVIGFLFGCAILQNTAMSSISINTWLILLSLFICDSTVSLVRKCLSRHKFWKPHRSHAYQNLSRKYNSHLSVTLKFIYINVLFIGPCAVSSHFIPTLSPILVVATYTALITAAIIAQSGVDGLYEK